MTSRTLSLSRLALTALAATLLATGVRAESPETFEVSTRSGPLALRAGDVEEHGRYVVLQLDRVLRAAERKALEERGVRLFQSLRDGAWLAAVEPGSLTTKVIQEFGLLSTAAWEPEHKVAPEVLRGEVPDWARVEDGTILLLVRFFPDVRPPDIEKALAAIALEAEPHARRRTWALRVEPDAIGTVAALDIVRDLAPGPRPLEPVLGDSRALLNVDSVQNADFSTPPDFYEGGLSVDGVRLDVSECVDQDHEDFWWRDVAGSPLDSRFINYSGHTCGITNLSAHGTHVAGIMAGSGFDSPSGGGAPYEFRGMAPEATLYEAADAWFLLDHRRVGHPHASNHSFIDSHGEYDGSVEDHDAVIHGDDGRAARVPQVWAAANQGTHAQHGNRGGRGEEGYYSIYAPAKNAICVGSVDANNGLSSSFSSLGPTFDGRIKPDVVAAGGKRLRIEPRMEIDWIRIVDQSKPAGTPCGSGDVCWEFDVDDDFGGWIDGSASHRISDWDVERGVLH